METNPGPLTLARFGSFTVGGQRVEVHGRPTLSVPLSRDIPDYLVDPNGVYSVGHAYVQYFVPAVVSDLPVIFVHGGGLTGVCWEATPDGRDGWLQHFLRWGHSCYVVDNVERGRAGWCPVPGIGQEGEPLLRTEQDAWDTFRIGPPEGYSDRVPFAGCQFPLESLEQLTRQQVPRWTTTNELSAATVSELIRLVGPCYVISHSQGGGIAANAAASTGELVAGLVLIEPHGLPDAGSFRSHSGRQLVVAGDFINRTALYRGLHARWISYLDGVRSIGVDAQYLDLAKVVPGNSHLPMMDRNSDSVASRIRSWLIDKPDSTGAYLAY